jgi:SET domain-containing protein
MSRSKQSKVNGHPAAEAKLNGHRPKNQAPVYVVRRSRIHGRGVFAARTIPKGARILEYTGRRISNEVANRLYWDREDGPTHTFLFELDDDMVIDAGRGGNAARWINHSCDPNCEAVDEDGRIFIEAIRAIAPGEELGYDYGIVLDEPHTPREKRRWPCFCGAASCRGTLLKPKRSRAKMAPGASA